MQIQVAYFKGVGFSSRACSACTCQQGLPAARGAVEEHPATPPEAAGKQLRMLQWQLDGVQDGGFDGFQATNVLPAHVRQLQGGREGRKGV